VKNLKGNLMDLLEIYKRGWDECFDGISHADEYEDPKERRAYQIGWNHYIIGDDVRSVDYLSEEEILKILNAPFA
jgi:hypothetical protein